MNSYKHNVKRPKLNAVAHAFTQSHHTSEPNSRFVDNRPEAITQRKLQEIANQSPQAKQAAQFQATANHHSNHILKKEETIQRKSEHDKNNENSSGLPENLKSGIELLSGYSLDDVQVHFNSGKPAQLHAHAYTQGKDIHVAPGQEKHLGHEAWHAVQQKQGIVKPTQHLQGKGNVNDDVGLEKQADLMGAKANAHANTDIGRPKISSRNDLQKTAARGDVIQHVKIIFTNVSKAYKEQADQLVYLLEQHKGIMDFIGNRSCIITLEGGRTGPPASIIPSTSQVYIQLAPWYFETYDLGHVMGMLCHEFGIHPLASEAMSRADFKMEKDYYNLNIDLQLPGSNYTVDPSLAESAKDKSYSSDHIYGTVKGFERYKVYRDVIFEMAQVFLDNSGNVKKDGVDPKEITNLLDCYLMDIASILGTNDHRLKGLMSGNTRKLIADIFNHSKSLLMQDAPPELQPYFPNDKEAKDIKKDYSSFVLKAASSLFKKSSKTKKAYKSKNYAPNKVQNNILPEIGLKTHWIGPDGLGIFSAIGYGLGVSGQDLTNTTLNVLKAGDLDKDLTNIGENPAEVIKCIENKDWTNSKVGYLIPKLVAIISKTSFTILMPNGVLENVGKGGVVIVKVTKPSVHYHATEPK